MPVISSVVLVGGRPVDGVAIAAYRAARFSSPPALNAAPPDGNPADATGTSGTTSGGTGEFRVTVPTTEDYYVSGTFGGVVAWAGPYPAAVSADLVHLAGAETITGVKTFNAAPVVPTAAFPESAVANLTTDLAAKASDSLALHLAGAETVTGAKTFNAGTLLDKGSAVFNVKAYGAVGDGSTDDTTAITAAVAAAASGGIVYFPPGTYISTTQTIVSNLWLMGAGFGASTLKLKNGANVDLLVTQSFATLTGGATQAGPSKFTIGDLTLDGNKANNASGWPLRIYGSNYKVDRLEVQNGASGGVWTEWGSGGSNMEAHWSNFKVHDCSGNGLDVNGPHDSTFTAGQVFKNTGIGIHNATNGGNGGNGCLYTAVHSWGSQTWAWSFDVLGLAVNCVAEGAVNGQVTIAGTQTQWMGGSVFASGGGATGFNITASAARLVIVAQVLDCTTAAIAAGTGCGSSYIQIYAFSGSAGTAFTGIFPEDAEVHISSNYNAAINTYHLLPASQANLGSNHIWAVRKAGGADATFVDQFFRWNMPQVLVTGNNTGGNLVFTAAMSGPQAMGTSYGMSRDNNSAIVLNGKAGANGGVRAYNDGVAANVLDDGLGGLRVNGMLGSAQLAMQVGV